MTSQVHTARAFIDDLVLEPLVDLSAQRRRHPAQLVTAVRAYRAAVLEAFGPSSTRQEEIWAKMGQQQREFGRVRMSGTQVAVMAGKRIQQGIELGTPYDAGQLVSPCGLKPGHCQASADYACTTSDKMRRSCWTPSCVSHISAHSAKDPDLIVDYTVNGKAGAELVVHASLVSLRRDPPCQRSSP